MANRRVKFSQTSCQKLVVPSDYKHAEIEFTDTVVQRLKLLVTRLGKRTFYYRYTYRGKKEVIRIGEFPDFPVEEAQRIARGYAAQLSQFQDPKVERTFQRDMLTLAEFVKDHYAPFAKLNKTSYKSDESKLRLQLLPAFGHKRLGDISQYDVQMYLSRIAETLSPATRNRHCSLISALYKLAIEWQLATSNPCRGIKKLAENPPPARVLDNDEVARVLSAIAEESNTTAGLALALLIFTGLRLNEVLQARWEHVDLNRQQLYLPHTKAGFSRYVPLNNEAVEVLAYQQEQRNGSPWVFPGKDPSKPMSTPRKAWQRVLTNAGVDYARIHDIRHSFASACVRNGTSLYIVQKLLGHASPVTTQRYAHLANDVLREASATAVQGFLKEAA